MASTTYPDGSSYTGGYLYGLKHGLGTLLSWNKNKKNLDKYCGSFKNDLKEGEGVQTDGQT